MRRLMRRHGARWLAGVLLASACAASAQTKDSPAPVPSHRDADGRFYNNYPHDPWPSFLRWQWERWRDGVPKIPEGGWHFELLQPDLASLRTNRTGRSVTWIGHATLLLQTGGLNIVTDPQFSDRAAPVSFLGPQRVVAPAIMPADLPHIDAVLISHNHYDHLDIPSLRSLNAQAGGPPRFFVPLGLKAWFHNTLGVLDAVELDWWQSAQLDTVTGSATLHLVPVQHWSSRTLTDRNLTLWGGWVLEQPDFRFMFCGDTGYSKDFADIQKRFGRFDLAAIPIGAYEPRWFMKMQHINPAEAVQIHRDLHADRSIAIHWGTFVLTDEPLDEPPRALRAALAAAGIPAADFPALKHGETLRLDLPAKRRP